MKLSELIEAVDDWRNKSAEDIYAELTAETEQFIDRQLWSLLGLAQIVGADRVQPFIMFLESLSLQWVAVQAAGRGVPIGDPTINAMLLEMNTAESLAIAKAGRRLVSRMQLSGLDETLERVSDTLAAMKLQLLKKEKSIAASVRYNDYVSALNAWNGDPLTEPVI